MVARQLRQETITQAIEPGVPYIGKGQPSKASESHDNRGAHTTAARLTLGVLPNGDIGLVDDGLDEQACLVGIVALGWVTPEAPANDIGSKAARHVPRAGATDTVCNNDQPQLRVDRDRILVSAADQADVTPPREFKSISRHVLARVLQANQPSNPVTAPGYLDTVDDA